MQVTLDGHLTDKVHIAVVQIDSPFISELKAVDLEDSSHAFQWNYGCVVARKNKIMSILAAISKTVPDVNLIVFPEYSVPARLLEKRPGEDDEFSLVEYANTNNIIIVAGSDQYRSPSDPDKYLKNVGSVIVPNIGVYTFHKHTLSEGESGIVKPGTSESSVFRLNWSHNDRHYQIQITLCLDFIEHYNTERIQQENHGIVIVPMCSSNVRDFCYINYIRKGIFVVYANAVDPNKNVADRIIGCSAIYGSKRKRDSKGAIVSADDEHESVISAELNLTHPYETSPKQLIKEGISVTSTKEKFYYIGYSKDSNELMLINSAKNTIPEDSTIVPNPYVFKNAMLKLLHFSFVKSLKYNELRNEVRSMYGDKSDSYGIIGDYDLIMSHFLDSNDLLDFKKGLDDSHYVSGEVTSLAVEKIFKFHSYQYDKTPSSDIKQKDLRILKDGTTLSKLKELVSEGAHGYSKDFCDGLVRHKIVLGKCDMERTKDKSRIHAFVCICFPQQAGKQATLFEKEVIKNYLTDDHVLSIYKTSSNADLPIHYIFDISSLPHHLYHLITELHTRADHYGIEIRSITYIVVEQLTNRMFGAAIDGLIQKEATFFEKEVDIDKLLKSDEGPELEFKASLRWDIAKKSSNKILEQEVAVAAACLANHRGGYLIIGVDDERNVVGIEDDFKTFNKKNRDGFTQALRNVLVSGLGDQVMGYIRIEFIERDGHDLCLIRIEPATMPVYVDGERFYIRQLSSCKPLNPKAATEYIRTRFQEHG